MPKWSKYLEDDFEDEYIPVQKIPHKKSYVEEDRRPETKDKRVKTNTKKNG